MSLEGKKCPKFSGDATGGISLSNKDCLLYTSDAADDL